MNRCIPQISTSMATDFCDTSSTCPDYGAYEDYANSWSEVGGQILGDVETCFWVIVAAFPIAMAVGFLWVYFMEKGAG